MLRTIISIILLILMFLFGVTAFKEYTVIEEPGPVEYYEPEEAVPEEYYIEEAISEEEPVSEAAPEEDFITGFIIYEDTAEDEGSSVLEDGVYYAAFDTDSSMFHVNETLDGKGMLTVEDGEMTIHVTLASKNILNLYPGLAEDAKKDGAVLLEPTVDSVTYSDGITEEVYGFDVPVPYLDEEFDLALIGTKGKWYDHKVSVSDPVSAE